MSSLPLAIRRLEGFGDYCNAIVVKEVRQSLKSRQFVGTFVLLLLVAWGGSIFGITMTGDSIEYGSSAEGFFILFFFLHCPPDFSDPQQRVEATSYQTVEALATFIARIATVEFGNDNVTVMVEKPSALAFVEKAGVEITRSKAFFAHQDSQRMKKA